MSDRWHKILPHILQYLKYKQRARLHRVCKKTHKILYQVHKDTFKYSRNMIDDCPNHILYELKFICKI
jgi:hypothetical protein